MFNELMISGVIRVDQTMSILLTMNKHSLHLQLHFVLHMPNVI